MKQVKVISKGSAGANELEGDRLTDLGDYKTALKYYYIAIGLVDFRGRTMYERIQAKITGTAIIIANTINQ